MSNITRRDFLATTSALAASAALAPTLRGVQPAAPSPAPAAPTSSKRTLRKAVMFGMIQPAGEATLTDKFQLIRDTGFEGVEMDSPSKITINDVRAAMEKTGIKVHGLVDSLHWRIPLNSPDPGARDAAIAALETCVADAKALGATSILLVPAIVNKDLAYDEAWGLSQSVLLNRVRPFLKDSGVKISIENVWNNFLLSPMEAAQYIDELNGIRWQDEKKRDGPPLDRSKHPFAFHFDIGNAITFGWPDQWIRILGERISRLHIKDFSRKKRDAEGLWKGFDVELGQGDAGWPAVMAALDRLGYSTNPAGNWATAEVRGGDANRLKEISAQMDALFAV